MFSTTARTLRTWWTDFSDDILGADLQPTPEPAAALDALSYHRAHAHRRPLGERRLRRPGSVPERPAFCLSPVRPPQHRPVPAAHSLAER